MKDISLRDYFAGQAIQGMLSNGFIPKVTWVDGNPEYDYVKAAYTIADKMLIEREV